MPKLLFPPIFTNFHIFQMWWVHAAGGQLSIKARIGVPPWLAEAIFQKYLAGKTSRVCLFLLLGFLRRYPVERALSDLVPRGCRLAGHNQIMKKIRPGYITYKPSPSGLRNGLSPQFGFGFG